MMDKFNISFNRLLNRIKNDVAIFGELYLFANLCMDELQSIHDGFISWGSFERNKLEHTGSLISVESYLNDQFDNALRRIYIETLNTIPLRYLMDDDEEQDLYLFDDGDQYLDYLFTDVDYQTGGRIDYTFVIWVPSSLLSRSDEIRSVVNFFRLFSKNFIIQVIGGSLNDFEVNTTFSLS